MQVNLITLEKQQYLDEWSLTTSQKAVMADLELQPIVDIMAADDHVIAKIATRLFFTPLTTSRALTWRQATVKHALMHPDYYEWLYQFTTTTIETVRQNFWELGHESASYHLYNKSRLLTQYLQAIGTILDKPLPDHPAPALQQWYQSLDTLFNGQLEPMKTFLRQVLFDHGYVLPAHLATNLDTTVDEVIDVVPPHRFQKVFTKLKIHAQGFEIAERDDHSAKALEHYKNQAVMKLATILVNVYQEVVNWFQELRLETGWLVGVIQLSRRLPAAPRCYATLASSMEAQQLINPLISLLLNQPAVANDFLPVQTALTVITGANQGGKTTFLRAVGLGELMAQAGMFVMATCYQTPPFEMVLTHFKREEDQGERHGKLDDELQRMDQLIHVMSMSSLVLMNESFASTNEHAGSQINFQITHGLLEAGVTVIAVSHQFEYTQLVQRYHCRPYFLVAQRQANGNRSYHMLPAAPKATSYGLDIYHRLIR